MNYNNEELEKYVSVIETIGGFVGRVPHNHINVLPVIMNSMIDECKVYFEIGTYHGSSIITSMRFNGKCKFYGLDFFGKGDNDEWSTRWGNQSALDNLNIHIVNNNIQKANVNEQEFDLIQGDSQSEETINLINERFLKIVDILFIDGDHSFDGVRNDFNNYKNLVRSGGYIIFDDYGFLPDVRKAVNSIDKKEFDIIGRLPLVNGNQFVNELDEQLNASFILRKK